MKMWCGFISVECKVCNHYACFKRWFPLRVLQTALGSNRYIRNIKHQMVCNWCIYSHHNFIFSSINHCSYITKNTLTISICYIFFRWSLMQFNFRLKANLPRLTGLTPKIRNTCITHVSQTHFKWRTWKGLFLYSLIFFTKCHLAWRLGRGIRHIRKATNAKALEQAQSLGFEAFLHFSY